MSVKASSVVPPEPCPACGVSITQHYGSGSIGECKVGKSLYQARYRALRPSKARRNREMLNALHAAQRQLGRRYPAELHALYEAEKARRGLYDPDEQVR